MERAESSPVLRQERNSGAGPCSGSPGFRGWGGGQERASAGSHRVARMHTLVPFSCSEHGGIKSGVEGTAVLRKHFPWPQSTQLSSTRALKNVSRKHWTPLCSFLATLKSCSVSPPLAFHLEMHSCTCSSVYELLAVRKPYGAVSSFASITGAFPSGFPHQE